MVGVVCVETASGRGNLKDFSGKTGKILQENRKH
jgi:hypothetical protein